MSNGHKRLLFIFKPNILKFEVRLNCVFTFIRGNCPTDFLFYYLSSGNSYSLQNEIYTPFSWGSFIVVTTKFRIAMLYENIFK